MGQGFRELRVWQEAKGIAVAVYRLVEKSPALKREWGLRDQMQRASVSVPSNIAEGDARKSDKDSIRFFHIALGSLAELITQLEIALELEMILATDASALVDSSEQLAKRIDALIKSRKSEL